MALYFECRINKKKTHSFRLFFGAFAHKEIISHIFYFISLILGSCAASKDPYISIEVKTTWRTFCLSLQEFRSDLSKITEINILLIVITNANEKCGDGHAQWGSEPVKAFVNVLKEGQSTEVDLEATLKISDDLKNKKNVGRFQVRNSINLKVLNLA